MAYVRGIGGYCMPNNTYQLPVNTYHLPVFPRPIARRSRTSLR
jgi:hypothetical protein